MRWINYVLISLIAVSTCRSDAQAQQLTLGGGDLDFLHLPYNSTFIAKNRIVEIEVEEQIKRSNQTIRPTGLRKRYAFDAAGNCTSRASYRNWYGRIDTILEAYSLSANDRLLEYRRNDRSGFHREVFKQRGDTLEICTYRGRDEDSSSTWMSCEYHVSTRKDTVLQTSVFNEQKLPYKRIQDQRDEQGFLRKRIETYTVSREQRVTTYSYNDNGRLSFRRQEGRGHVDEYTYIYDEEGLLSEVLFRQDGELVWKRAIVIDDRGLISALITLDVASEDIRIERFTYQRR